MRDVFNKIILCYILNGRYKKYIPTPGNASDFDGFMTIPLYYNAEAKTGRDVIYYPSFLDIITICDIMITFMCEC